MELSRNKSYTHGCCDIPLIGLTCHELLEKRAEEIPDQAMYVFASDQESVTFGGFKNKVEELAAGLLAQGLKKGDCVAALGSNHMEWPLIIGATRAIGVLMLRMQTGYTIQTMKTSMIKTSCKALFLMRSPEDLYKKACAMLPELEKSTPGKIQSNEIPSMTFVVAVGANHQSGTLSLTDISKLGREKQFIAAFNRTNILVSSDDVSHFGFTSGSTGEPKMVPYSHFSSLNGTYFSLDYMLEVKERSTRRMSCVTNMAYVGGEVTGVIPPLVFGITSVFPSPTYNFEKILQTTQDERCTDITLLLFGLIDLVNSPIVEKYDLSSLKMGLTAGSPVPLHLLGEIEKKYGIKILNSYGSSETIFITSQLPSDKLEYSTTVGRIVPHVEMKVVDKDGLPVGVEVEGEIWARSPFTCKGYYLNSEATQKAFTHSGWLKMGDVGMLNMDGYLTIKGRIKDIIIKFARNIYPVEVESVIAKNQSVQKVQVVGVPDMRSGEEVCACVILKDNCTLTLEDVRSYCIEKVSENAMPGYLLIFDTFPYTSSGKFDRKRLNAIAMERLKLK